jgi:hypothetical protein
MANAKQLWIIIHNNVIYAIFGVITKENFNQSSSAPHCAGQLYGISVDWSQTVSSLLQLGWGGGGGGGGGGARLRSVADYAITKLIEIG